MRFRALVCATLFLAPTLSSATNTFNLRCPAQATLGTIAPAPTGWSLVPGQAKSPINAYMPNSTALGCDYASFSSNSGSLQQTVASGVICGTTGDGKTFNCSNGKTVTCPAQTVIGYEAPLPVGWSGGAGNSSAEGGVFQNTTYDTDTVLDCDYNGFGGVLFASVPVGSTCTVDSNRLSFDCTTPFVINGAPVSKLLSVLDSPTMTWLSSKIVFTNGDGSSYPYSSWSTIDRNRFQALYQTMLNGTALNVNCPINIASQMGSGLERLYYFRAQALDIYMAQVAHMFYIEATQSVPWSFLSFSNQMLIEALSSKSLFSPIQVSKPSNTYPSGITVGKDFQSPFRDDAEGAPSFVCDPTIGYRFMTGKSRTSGVAGNLIGPDRDTTLTYLSVWFAENVAHDVSGLQPANPSQQALLQDRETHHNPQTGRGIMLNNGCHGGSNLFYDIARSVNLPVVPASMVEDAIDYPLPAPAIHGTLDQFTHGGLVYAWGEPGERVLQHHDDIDAMGNRTWGPIDGNGNLLTPAQNRQVFFNTIWRTPADIAARGFQYNSVLPWVVPGLGWGTYERTGGNEDRPDFGRFFGLWTPNGQDPSGYANAYYMDQGYDLCRWQDYLAYYCQQPLGQSPEWIGFVTPPPTGPFHSIADHTAHAAACVQAGGGCSALSTQWALFYSNVWGTDIVVNP